MLSISEKKSAEMHKTKKNLNCDLIFCLCSGWLCLKCNVAFKLNDKDCENDKDGVTTYITSQKSKFKGCCHGTEHYDCPVCQRLLLLWVLKYNVVWLPKDLKKFMTKFLRQKRKFVVCSHCSSRCDEDHYDNEHDNLWLDNAYYYDDAVNRIVILPGPFSTFYDSYVVLLDQYGTEMCRNKFEKINGKICVDFDVDNMMYSMYPIYKHQNFKLYVCDSCITLMIMSKKAILV